MDEESMEVTEEAVLEVGNQILSVLGAEEPVTDLEPFKTDALYIQIFKTLFPHLPLDDLNPGSDFEEMADNLRALRELLGESILDTDINHISATAILNGDLSHIGEFLQILLQVILLLAEGEGEGDQDSSPSAEKPSSKKERKSEAFDPLDFGSPEDDKHADDLFKQIEQDEPIIK
jgi:hypothetical protein